MWFWVRFLWPQSCLARSSSARSRIPHAVVHCHPELCWYNCLGGCAVNSSVKISLQKNLRFSHFLDHFIAQSYSFIGTHQKGINCNSRAGAYGKTGTGNIFSLLPNQIKCAWNHAQKFMVPSLLFQQQYHVKEYSFPALNYCLFAALSVFQAAWSPRSASQSRLQMYK